MGVPQENDREKRAERRFKEIMAENFQNVMKDEYKHPRNSSRMNSKIPLQGHTTIKMSKVQVNGRIYKAAKKKQLMYKETSMIINRFLIRNSEGQR